MNIETKGYSFEILNARQPDDANRWLSLWQQWPKREVFAHPEYVKLYADGESRPLCAIWESEEIHVLYPFLLRDLTRMPFWSPDLPHATDIITPYGYGGPFVWGEGDIEAVSGEFWALFDTWALQQNVVSEFVRFTLFPDTVLPYQGEVRERNKNVIRDLDTDEATIWMDFKPKVRRNVKKAIRSRVQIVADMVGDRFDDFISIYTRTMDRCNASDYYYFPSTYYEHIHQELQGSFIYFHALRNEKIISTELVLISVDNVYFFLGGTDREAFELRPNDLLKYEIILWARQQGKRRYVLGGGYELEDGIFRYKQSFAPNGIVPYCTGHRIFRYDLYDRLVENRAALAKTRGETWPLDSDFFPKYRA